MMLIVTGDNRAINLYKRQGYVAEAMDGCENYICGWCAVGAPVSYNIAITTL